MGELVLEFLAYLGLFINNFALALVVYLLVIAVCLALVGASFVTAMYFISLWIYKWYNERKSK